MIETAIEGAAEGGCGPTLGDFTVISEDITNLSPKAVLSIHVVKTIVGGKSVYEAKQPAK